LGRVLSKLESENYDPALHPGHLKIGKHIADWLSAAVVNQEPWLANIDTLGRPKKLLKFPTLDAITREADKAMLRYAQQSQGVILRDGDEGFVMALANGYYVVRLLTPEALDWESGEMQHCIGNGGYDDSLSKNSIRFLSLRDARGKPHATLEVNDGRVVQLQGKQNKQPNREYLELLAPFLRNERLVLSGDQSDVQLMFVDDYRVVDAWDLSDCKEIVGDLKRTDAELRLPEKLIVRGDVVIRRSSFPNGFPREIVAEGQVLVSECREFVVSKRITAGGDVSIREAVVEGTIEHLESGGSVSFRRTTLAKLPKYMHFQGSLDISKSCVSSLEGLNFVGGNLDISNTPVEMLPPNIRIEGSLDANSSRLKDYPASAFISKDVDISHTSVSKLPAVDVKGTLDITCTGITEIPEGLSVSSLSARGLLLQSFPSSVSIRRDLDLSYSNVKLPDGLTVGGVITLESADVGALPADLQACKINGDDAKITSIGHGLIVTGSLQLCRTQITTLPNDMDVWGNILVRQTPIDVLPDGFSCSGDLDLSQTLLTVVPDGLKVGGSLVMHSTKIAELPDDLYIGKDLVITDTDVTLIPDTVEIGRCVRSDVASLDTGMKRYKNIKKVAATNTARPIF
jgi:hypothetical protein